MTKKIKTSASIYVQNSSSMGEVVRELTKHHGPHTEDTSPGLLRLRPPLEIRKISSP